MEDKTTSEGTKVKLRKWLGIAAIGLVIGFLLFSLDYKPEWAKKRLIVVNETSGAVKLDIEGRFKFHENDLIHKLEVTQKLDDGRYWTFTVDLYPDITYRIEPAE